MARGERRFRNYYKGKLLTLLRVNYFLLLLHPGHDGRTRGRTASCDVRGVAHPGHALPVVMPRVGPTPYRARATLLLT